MVDRTQASRRIDQPEPCFVRLRLIKDGVPLAARIFHRLGMLTAEINGAPAEIDFVWQSGDLITAEQYAIMMETPEPNPYRVVHVSTAGLADLVREQDEADYWLTQPIR